MVGINNLTQISMDNVTSVGNFSSPVEFFINLNNVVFDGYLFYILLWVFWVVLYFSAQGFHDQPLNNAMYSGAVITVLSFMLRAVYIIRGGVSVGLLTDHLLWTFPIITVVLAFIVWATKE